MREITTHKIAGTINDGIEIRAVDEPGPGGANHVYECLFQEDGCTTADFSDKRTKMVIRFQNGAIKEVGVNGLTNEALLAIVMDRLRSFQAGQFSCRTNAVALTYIETGLLWLQERTRERMMRGVEGTLQK